MCEVKTGTFDPRTTFYRPGISRSSLICRIFKKAEHFLDIYNIPDFYSMQKNLRELTRRFFVLIFQYFSALPHSGQRANRLVLGLFPASVQPAFPARENLRNHLLLTNLSAIPISLLSESDAVSGYLTITSYESRISSFAR